MWNLVVNYEHTIVYNLFETNDEANVHTNLPLYQFTTKQEALNKIAELGLEWNDT